MVSSSEPPLNPMKRFIEEQPNHSFDVIIIGGGVSGAAVAYDTASRGLKTALVERADFGGGTSAATSKLIHGGIRYLKNMEFRLVRESLRERRILENIAPNLVSPIPFLITTQGDGVMQSWLMMKLGLLFYDLLSWDKGRTWDKFQKIPSHGSPDPSMLQSSHARHAFVYYDCISHSPERLTLSFLKSAVKYGACISNYAEVTEILEENHQVTGVRVRDVLKGGETLLKSLITVNCGGPWVDTISNMAGIPQLEKNIRRSEGIHLITSKPLLKDHALLAMLSKHRHLICVPWRNHILVGTTDTEYTGDPDNYTVSSAGVEELLGKANEYFGPGTLERSDILRVYGGLRPLTDQPEESSYRSSRRYEIVDHAPNGVEGFITVEGGKYTTSRSLAQKTTDLILRKLNLKPKPCITSSQFLEGSQIPDIQEFVNCNLKKYHPYPENTIRTLCRHYGTEIDAILSIAAEDPELATPLNDDGEILAQAVYAARHEMAQTPPDILLRRTGLGSLKDPDENLVQRVSQIFSQSKK